MPDAQAAPTTSQIDETSRPAIIAAVVEHERQFGARPRPPDLMLWLVLGERRFSGWALDRERAAVRLIDQRCRVVGFRPFATFAPPDLGALGFVEASWPVRSPLARAFLIEELPKLLPVSGINGEAIDSAALGALFRAHVVLQ